MIPRVKKVFKWLLTLKLLIVAVFVILASYTNVPTTPTSNPRKYSVIPYNQKLRL